MRTALSAISENIGAVSQEPPKGNPVDANQMIDVVKSVSSQLSDPKSFNFRHILKTNLHDRQTKRKRESSIEYGLQSSPRKATIIAKSTSPFDLNWDLFKRWPQGVAEEEQAMSDYFRSLKRFHIEQETQQLFMAYTNDGAQYHLYTKEEVEQMEEQVQQLKKNLKERKGLARNMRIQIEALCDELKLIDTLKGSVKEAEDLTSEVRELELELEKLRASRARRSSGGRKSSGLDSDRRAMTQEQALQSLNEQLEEMQSLEDEHAETLRATDVAKKKLAEGMQSLDRLQIDYKAAEERLDTAKGQKKDVKAEKACKSYSATLTILKNLVGVVSVEAPTPTILRCVYNVQDESARDFCAEIAILVHFVSPGGRIEHYEMQSQAGQVLTDRYAPLESLQRMHLDCAVKANDTSLLLQEILSCIEQIEPEG